MAKVSKSRVTERIKKIVFEDLPLNVENASMDYGFDKPVIYISVNEGLNGKPFEGITKSNVKVTAIASPNGWAVKKKMKVGPVYNKAEGYYIFTISDKGDDLKKGPYTLAIQVKSVVGKKVFRGQSLLQLTVK